MSVTRTFIAFQVQWMLQLQRYCGVALSRDMGSTMSVLSDGDAKTYNHLVDLNVYGDDCPVTKEQCVNHVSKRLTITVVSVFNGPPDEWL